MLNNILFYTRDELNYISHGVCGHSGYVSLYYGLNYNFICTGEKFHDTAVEVSNSTAYVQRGFYKGPAMTKEVIEILCEYPTVGRFVQLRILEGTKNNLNILELEIFALSYLSYMYCDPRGCLVQ